MKKKFIYIATFFLFIVATGFIILRYKKDAEKKELQLFELIARKGNDAQNAEWKTSKKLSGELINKINANPNDLKSLSSLTAIYLQEARNTGNFSFYDKAAMNCVNRVLKIDAKNFEALTFKATIFLSQHHFTDGLNLANEIVKQYPYSAFVYGILVDANVELGNYKEAVANAEKMISLRPDLRSYSRISYLREIHGDINGAIEAMKLAVDAGSPGIESTEWARVQLGKLYEQKGEMKYAEMNYTISLQNRADYPYALAGMARIATANKDYNKANEYYSRAASLSNDYSFREAMIEVYNLSGEKFKADQLANDIIDEMVKAAELSQKDPTAGHYADKEMAWAYLSVDNYDKALEHALLEYNRRPNNIDVNETLGWVYFKKNDFVNATSYINAALKTNCKNPSLLCHAGLIFFKAGNKTAAINYLEDAISYHPNISSNLFTESETALNFLTRK
jgi:tetratricopeptide (TPR) repeat protein